MTKQPSKQGVKKKTFNLKSFKEDNNLDHNVKDKPLEFIPWSDAFYEATGIPGMAIGYLTLLRGYSNTGKSTGVYETISSALKMRDEDGNPMYLPVLFDTENSWNWEHAKSIGVPVTEVVNEETGEVSYDTDMLYYDNEILLNLHGCYKYDESKMGKNRRDVAVLEDVAREINILLEKQKSGELPVNLIFIWDSIGTLDCYKSVISGGSNNMWNAGALEQAFKQIINFKIPSSKKETSEYTNSFLCVQKIWFDSQSGGQGTVKHKGGEAFYYAARLIVHYGGIKAHGTSNISVVYQGNSTVIGMQTKISIVKNHINGIQYEGKKIAATPHGYINPDKLDKYKKEHISYLSDKITNMMGHAVNVDVQQFDFTITENIETNENIYSEE